MLDQQMHYSIIYVYSLLHISYMFSTLLSRCLQLADTSCKHLFVLSELFPST